MQIMKQLKLLMLAMLSILAFGAVATTVASAEDGPEPALLTSEGKVTALVGEFKGEKSTLSTLGGKILEGTGVTATIAGCEELEKKEKDTNLCHSTKVEFTGVTSEEKKVNCRSETAAGAKDGIGVVLTLLDAHLAAGVKGSELTPLIIFEVLGIAKEAELTIVCGVLKDKVKGRIACLLAPGLTQVAAKGKFEVLCKAKSNGDPEEEECTQLPTTCKELKEKPFESNLGAGFEMAAMAVHLEGSFNQGVFIDD
jgi:hypothetical protein